MGSGQLRILLLLLWQIIIRGNSVLSFKSSGKVKKKFTGWRAALNFI